MFYSCHWKFVFKNINSNFIFHTYFKTLGETTDINVVFSTNINWDNFQLPCNLKQDMMTNYNC